MVPARNGERPLATPLAPHRAPDLLDPRHALGQCHVADREGDAEAGTRRAEEEPARWVDELMPSRRRPDPEPTLSLSLRPSCESATASPTLMASGKWPATLRRIAAGKTWRRAPNDPASRR